MKTVFNVIIKRMQNQWLTFSAIAALMTITPGADTALVIKNSLSGARRTAYMSALGICSGLFAHAIASTLGLSVILAQSATAYNIVRLTGAVYLIYLGVRALLSAWRGVDATGLDDGETDKRNPSRSLRSYFIEGALNNILNPKVAIFYLTFLPQFIDPVSGSVTLQGIGLAAIHATQGVIWLFACAYFVTRLSAIMRRPKVRRRMEALTGLVLVGFGIRVALEKAQ